MSSTNPAPTSRSASASAFASVPSPAVAPVHPGIVNNPWFASLATPDQQALLAHAQLLRLQPGEMLFRQGAAPGGFYGLLKGTLKISSLREDGREAILVLLEPGNWMGEISLIDGEPRTHDATALCAAELLVVPQAAFYALMESVSFAQAMTRLLAGRVRSLYGVVEDSALRSTRTRVAKRLLLLARGDATQSADTRLSVPVSQEALAMMLGMTRQTVSKELKFLQAQALVVVRYGRIDILSATKLQSV